MKNNKKKSPMMKIVSAAAMLAVSASMLATSTYAWFAMNNEVTVKGMSITAKSDTTFLVVKAVGSEANTVAGVKSYNKTEDNAYLPSAQLYPVAHDALAAEKTISDIEKNDTTDSTLKDIWFYKYSNDPTSSNVSVTDASYVPVANFGQYVLVNAFDLTVNGANNNASISNLKVKSCSITPDTNGDAAVKVLVAGPNGCEEFSNTGGSGTNVLCSSITNNALSQIKVYVYWDGEDDDVYTNGVADLLNTAVQVEFTGTVINS